MNTDLISKTSGWRGSRDIWVQAAYEALLDGGIDAVKVMPLERPARTVAHQFLRPLSPIRQDLLDALITLWQTKNTGNLVQRTEAYAETITEAMLNIFDLWLMPELFDSRLEFAVRNWAHTDPQLAKLLNEADQVRVDALEALFLRFGNAPQYAKCAREHRLSDPDRLHLDERRWTVRTAGTAPGTHAPLRGDLHRQTGLRRRNRPLPRPASYWVLNTFISGK
jgi:hypothetical protein